MFTKTLNGIIDGRMLPDDDLNAFKKQGNSCVRILQQGETDYNRILDVKEQKPKG